MAAGAKPKTKAKAKPPPPDVEAEGAKPECEEEGEEEEDAEEEEEHEGEEEEEEAERHEDEEADPEGFKDGELATLTPEEIKQQLVRDDRDPVFIKDVTGKGQYEIRVGRRQSEGMSTLTWRTAFTKDKFKQLVQFNDKFWKEDFLQKRGVTAREMSDAAIQALIFLDSSSSGIHCQFEVELDKLLALW